MLCEMRGYDGNMSGWNGSHGSSGIFRKMEFGAYVVNSNKANGYNSSYQVDPDVVLTRYESRNQGFRDSLHHELRASSAHVPQYIHEGHQQRQAEQPALREKRQLNPGNASSHRMTMIEQNSGSHPQWSNSGENRWISTHETETNRSTHGSAAGNIYQGPVVRVQVPDAYYEGGSVKGNETAQAYWPNMSYNVDDERTGQHSQRFREIDEIYDGPVPVETYRRINDWLKNCQQYSSGSFKSSQVSYGSNHSRTEDKLKQSSTSGNFSRADYRSCKQSSNISNLKLPSEPRVVAALEPKATMPGDVLQPNHQQGHQNADWSKKREVPVRQSSAPRKNNVASAFSSYVGHVSNMARSYFESDLSKTASEWSSETLSIIGSDKGSYCTDFTPFELGHADAPSEVRLKHSKATSASECPMNGGENFSTSHVIIDDRIQMKNAAYPKNCSDTLHDSFGNEFVCTRRNDNSSFDSVWNANSEPHSKQQRLHDKLTDKIPKTPKSFEAPVQTSKTARVANAFIADSKRLQRANPDLDNITKPSNVMQNHYRYKKTTANTVSSASAVQNLKIFDRRVHNEDRKSVHVPSETKLCISDRKPVIPLRCVSHEYPLSSKFTDQNPPSSTRAGNDRYKQSSNEKDSALLKQLESRPVAQIRSGSLSITIRPSRLTVMDYFQNIDDVWDSSRRKEEPEMRNTVQLLSDNELMEETADNTTMHAKVLEMNGDPDDLNSDSSGDVSDVSEELDEFTKTVIKADISERVLHSSSKTESFSKPQYNALKHSKFPKSDKSSLLVDMHGRCAGKVSQMQDDTNMRSEHQANKGFVEQSNVEDDTYLNSGPSLVSQRQLRESRSSLLPRKFTDSPNRNLQMKFSKNDCLVDQAFEYNSENMKCKREDPSKTNLRSSSEKKRSEMYLSASKNVLKITSPEFHSFIKNYSNSHTFRSDDASITPNGSTGRMVSELGELYTDDRSHVQMVSTRSPALEASSDAISDRLGPESVPRIGSEANTTAEESVEEDGFLMSLLQQCTSDIPEFESFYASQLQPQTLVHISKSTMQSDGGENSEQLPVISCTGEFGKEIALRSMMKSPETFEISHLREEETGGLDGKLLACGIYESPKENGEKHCGEHHRWKSQETDCPRKISEQSTDSPSSFFEEVTAALAAIQRSHSHNSDSMTHEDVEDERQCSDRCSKMSTNYAGSSFTRDDTTKSVEAMCCQEFIDFPNLVIDPPDTFSDFTIVL